MRNKGTRHLFAVIAAGVLFLLAACAPPQPPNADSRGGQTATSATPALVRGTGAVPICRERPLTEMTVADLDRPIGQLAGKAIVHVRHARSVDTPDNSFFRLQEVAWANEEEIVVRNTCAEREVQGAMEGARHRSLGRCGGVSAAVQVPIFGTLRTVQMCVGDEFHRIPGRTGVRLHDAVGGAVLSTFQIPERGNYLRMGEESRLVSLTVQIMMVRTGAGQGPVFDDAVLHQLVDLAYETRDRGGAAPGS